MKFDSIYSKDNAREVYIKDKVHKGGYIKEKAWLDIYAR